MASAETNNSHALVFGASGIIGWAVVNAILSDYPTAQTFRAVTAVTNRPLDLDTAQWPATEKLTVVSGLDLLQGSQSDLEAQMKLRIPYIQCVDIVYFCAYAFDPNRETEVRTNVEMLRRAVTAVESLSNRFRFLMLPTGTKAYGVHLLDQFPWRDHLPLKESLPRIPEPFASQLFYYHQLDLLKCLSAGKPWTFCTVMPDIIVGFVPNNNGYGLAQWLALYLSLYREIHADGAEVVFPGTTESWTNKSNDSSQDTIARFAIYASRHPQLSAGQSFNIADSARPSTWSVKWPVICDYFGLRGVAPDAESPGPDPVEFIARNRDTWLEIEKRHGLQTGHIESERSVMRNTKFIMSDANFDRDLDLTKTGEVWGSGFRDVDTRESWYTAFDRFRKARIIP